MTREIFQTLTLAAALLAGPAQPGVGAVAAIPACSATGPARTLLAQPRTFEAAAFDRQGRLLVSDSLGNRIDVLDHPGGRAAHHRSDRRARRHRPAARRHGSGRVRDRRARSPLPDLRLRPADATGSRHRTARPYAGGLSMGNGVAIAPDGTVYTSNDLVPALDRVDPDGTMHRGWYRETPANGPALSPDGRILYVNVSLGGDTRILAIDTATGVARGRIPERLPR
ncbi:SMP-30/gluconolactonase/LRE family protein [Nocardia asiatica]|uniref:SMP-30/gluconolactonase/LRE family protein n=1 Tax=Nocardia asiatica TaxID=209252 RepID=UPI0024567068|nr:hypothetical protein [Nocardia asiatica]